MNNKIIIAAGGTGGHLYPGLAIAVELKKRNFIPLFVVREKDSCIELLEREKTEFFEISIKGMPRKLNIELVKFFFKLIKSFFYTWRMLKQEKPCVIIGMGGYISFPVVLIGRLQGIPTIIHEQNFIPGLTNKILCHIADKVAVSFKESIKNFPANKTIITGNPVRKELFLTSFEDACKNLGLKKDKFTILVFGGSQGADKINKVVINSFKLMWNIRDKIQFLHIAGKRNFEFIEKEYADKKLPGLVLPYLHNIGDAYVAADLIICRAGATTIAELSIFKKPVILIPFPYAAANHQEFNAMVLVNNGMAEMIIEKDLNEEVLFNAVFNKYALYNGKKFSIKLPDIFPQEILAEHIVRMIKP